MPFKVRVFRNDKDDAGLAGPYDWLGLNQAILESNPSTAVEA